MSLYTLAHICGAPYTGGRICFSPDGGCIIAPVGNRITVYDLQTSKSTTLSSQARSDIAIVSYHPTLPLAILIDVSGYGYILNLLRDRVLHRLQFKSSSTVPNEKKQAAALSPTGGQRLVSDAAFSPDAKFFAVAIGTKLLIWRSPNEQISWRMTLHRELVGHMDTITSVDWSTDSRFICTASNDLTVRLWSANPIDGFVPCAFVDHRRPVKSAFFSKDMSRICAISKEGVIIVWKVAGEDNVEEANAAKHLGCNKKKAGKKTVDKDLARNDFVDAADIATVMWVKETQAYCNQAKNTVVSRVAVNKNTNIVVIGFTGGLFGLYKFPSFDSIYTLRIGNELPVVDSVDVSNDGDWLGLACSETGTLVVWEWKSETFIMKQQGHRSGIRCVAFSTGGSDSINIGGVVDKEMKGDVDQNYAGNKLGLGTRYLVATGGFDGKVKLWDGNSGLCFVTFEEHTASVEAICFTPQANAIITASLDGTVRAFDLLRYRNFRTLTASRVQFISVACDPSGSIICAGSKGEANSVFIWSLQTGKLLDELHGHSAAVTSVAFHPNIAYSGFLVSASWDKFINVWNIYGRTDKGGATEPILNPSSIVAIAFDPRDNNLLAAAVLCGHIVFWDLDIGEQIGTIDGIRDLQTGRDHGEFYAANNSRGGKGQQEGDLQAGLNRNQHFNSISYISSGRMIVAGSRNSAHICVYSTETYSLLFALTLTNNRSFTGILRELNSRYMTEYGHSIQEYDLSDEDEPVEGAAERRRILAHNSLPGVQSSELMKLSKRFHVWQVSCSPDGRQFAAATSHGLYIYSMDSFIKTPNYVKEVLKSVGTFQPQLLTKNVTTGNVLAALEQKEYAKAFILALALNEFSTLLRCYEAVPLSAIGQVVASIDKEFICVLLNFIRAVINPDSPSGTIHLNWHLIWLEKIFEIHMHSVGGVDDGGIMWQGVSPCGKIDMKTMLLLLLRQLRQTKANVSGVLSSNAHTVEYIRRLLQQQQQGIE